MADWINWDGGDCPVGATDMVFVRLRDGNETNTAHKAQEFNWQPDTSEHKDRRRKFDITAYRLA